MFENFPYTDMHQLNLDWIIKIAKDFLDQYTHIQELIANGEQSLQDLTASGLEQLTEKAETLENLLQQWYNTHSQDIANQLADAIADINTTLLEKIAAFNSAAELKAAQTIASIPADYTEVTNTVKHLNRCLLSFNTTVFEKGSLNPYGEDDDYFGDSRIRSGLVYLTKGLTVYKKQNAATNTKFTVYYFDDGNNFVSATTWQDNMYIPAGTNFKLLCSLNYHDNDTATLEQILAGFEFVTDETGISQGSLQAQGLDDHSWKFYERVRDSYIKYAKKDTQVFTFGGRFTVNKYTSNGTIISITGWNTMSYIIPKGTYYRCVYSIDDTALLTPSNFSNYFRVISEPDFKNIIENENIEELVQRGTLLGTSFTTFHQGQRICTTAKLKSSVDIIIYRNQYYLDIYLYDNNGSVVQQIPWIENDFYIPANQMFGFNIDKKYYDDDTATIDELLSSFDFKILTNKYSGLNPNIILQARNVDDHRYPPYSKYYIQAACKNQYDRVRVNIRITTDDHFVLIHDNTINTEARNMGGSVISETIPSSGQTITYLNSFDWGIKYGNIYAGMKVPEFEDACKYAAKYNMGLTIETVDIGASTPIIKSNIDRLFEILSKYGLVENLIVITASGSYFGEMEYWKAKNKYISYFIGGEENTIISNKTNIDSLMTGYNDIYVMPYPWGSTPTTTLINFCANNSYRLYSSIAMNKQEMLTLLGFDKGTTLIESNNTYAIKNIIQRFNDEHIND